MMLSVQGSRECKFPVIILLSFICTSTGHFRALRLNSARRWFMIEQQLSHCEPLGLLILKKVIIRDIIVRLMEIIVITDNQSYEGLIPGASKIYSPKSDLIGLLETELFLNHHKHIGLFLLKDNLPAQHQFPMRIVERLLDRNDGSVELQVNHGGIIELTPDLDLVEIFSKFQLGLKLQLTEGQHLHYSFKYWDITIELTIANIWPKLSHFQRLVDSSTTDQCQQTEKISKVILYIDKLNYKSFVEWADSDWELGATSEHNSQSLILSHEYLTLKQQISHERNAFRNKIKMLEGVLGESLNLNKLLCEDDQEQRGEFRRLKETFEKVKNIDNVLFEQEKHIHMKEAQLRQQKAKKERINCQNSQQYASLQKQIIGLQKQNKNLLFALGCLEEEKMGNRSFEANEQVQAVLETEVQKFQQSLNRNKWIRKDSFGNSFMGTTNKTFQPSHTASLHSSSMHNSIDYYRRDMRAKYFANMTKKSKYLKPHKANDRSMANRQSLKSIELICESRPPQPFKREEQSRQHKKQIVRLQELLVREYEYFQYCETISQQMRKRISNRDFRAFGATPSQSGLQLRQFPILHQIIKENIDYGSLALLPTHKPDHHEGQLNCFVGPSQRKSVNARIKKSGKQDLQ